MRQKRPHQAAPGSAHLRRPQRALAPAPDRMEAQQPNDDGSGLLMAAHGANISPKKQIIRWKSVQ